MNPKDLTDHLLRFAISSPTLIAESVVSIGAVQVKGIQVKGRTRGSPEELLRNGLHAEDRQAAHKALLCNGSGVSVMRSGVWSEC